MLVNEFLEISAKRFPDKEALIYEAERLTYCQIDQASNTFANILIANDFQRQDVGLIYLENSDKLVISYFGILKAAGTVVTINPLITPKRLLYILNDCKAKTLITNGKNLEKIKEILNHAPHIKNIILIDDEQSVCNYDFNYSYLNIMNLSLKVKSFYKFFEFGKMFNSRCFCSPFVVGY